jgi:hypothetical protein
MNYLACVYIRKNGKGITMKRKTAGMKNIVDDDGETIMSGR